MEKNQQFTCPMHPEIINDAPGTCPKCGMDMPVEEHGDTAHVGHSRHTTHSSHRHTPEAYSQHDAHADHDKHAGHHTGDFLKRFWICLILTIPVLALSHMIQQWFGFHIAFTGDKYVLLVLGSAIYLYDGMPFFKGMKVK